MGLELAEVVRPGVLKEFENSASDSFRIPGRTMRVGMLAYMIYLEGPDYPEYVMHFLPEVFWDPQIWEYVR